MNALLRSACILLCLLAAWPALAIDEEYEPVQDAHIAMHVTNPQRDLGYHVGDLLTRTITLEVKKPYVLQDTSLPIVGYEKKVKGQWIGIDLREVSKTTLVEADKTVYTLRLTYQVFVNNVVARKVALPAEMIKFNGAGNTVEIRIPSWGFRVSPLAVYGAVKIEYDMSPYRGPLLLDPAPERQRLYVLLAVFGLSLLGLLYVHGTAFWLPRMGGPFARACSGLRKLPATEEGLKQALVAIHQAFNTTAGHSVFSDNLDAFLVGRPNFVLLRQDIERFFGLSSKVFFASTDRHDLDRPTLEWLQQFCLKCRHCERGLHVTHAEAP